MALPIPPPPFIIYGINPSIGCFVFLHSVSASTTGAGYAHWSFIVERSSGRTSVVPSSSVNFRQLEQHIGLPSSSGHISCSRPHPHSVNLDNSSNTLVFCCRAEDRTPLVPSPSVKTTQAAHSSSLIQNGRQSGKGGNV